MKMKSLAPILLLTCLAALLFTVQDAAADYVYDTATVYNTAGVPQADTTIYDATTGDIMGVTNGGGVAVISFQTNCTPGGDYTSQPPACDSGRPYANDYFGTTRSADDNGDPCTTAPEGWPGTRLTVSYMGQAGNGRSYVPSLSGTAYQPALSNEELGMVGEINQERVANGMAPVTVSSILTASADKYLGSVPTRKLDYDDDALYCENSGPGIRAVDVGFPTSDISESVLQGDANAYAAFTDLDDDSHQDVLEDSDVKLIGIAQEGGTWVIDTSTLETNDTYYSRAGDTGEAGNSLLVAGEFPLPPADNSGTNDNTSSGSRSNNGTRNSAQPKETHLKLTQIKVHGRNLLAICSLARSADGVVHAVAINKSNRKLKVVLKTKKLANAVKISGHLRPGVWIIKAHFLPTAGTTWQEQTVQRQIRIH